MPVLSRWSTSDQALLAAALACAFVFPLRRTCAARAGARGRRAVAWPGGARMALSLSFDDGRESQVTQGLPVFARHGVKVTLYVVPSAVERHLDGWKQAAAAGHEIGNHSLTHSCSGNFPFSRQKALEEHSIARMREELAEANRADHGTARRHAADVRLSVRADVRRPRARPRKAMCRWSPSCSWPDAAGWTRPPTTRRTSTWRRRSAWKWTARTSGRSSRCSTRRARAGRGWCWPGHDIGAGGRQTTRIAMLDELFAYAKDPANGIWLATVAEAADVVARRGRP